MEREKHPKKTGEYETMGRAASEAEAQAQSPAFFMLPEFASPMLRYPLSGGHHPPHPITDRRRVPPILPDRSICVTDWLWDISRPQSLAVRSNLRSYSSNPALIPFSADIVVQVHQHLDHTSLFLISVLHIDYI